MPGLTRQYKTDALPLSQRGEEGLVTRKLLVGIEPTIFRLEGGRNIHFATGAWPWWPTAHCSHQAIQI